MQNQNQNQNQNYNQSKEGKKRQKRPQDAYKLNESVKTMPDRIIAITKNSLQKLKPIKLNLYKNKQEDKQLKLDSFIETFHKTIYNQFVDHQQRNNIAFSSQIKAIKSSSISLNNIEKPEIILQVERRIQSSIF
ncbi:hypothetical protein pb186bvf_005725 [Paramecium bursaria]